MFYDAEVGSDFLDMIPKAKTTRKNKLQFIKDKIFCPLNAKRQLTKWREYVQILYLICIKFKIYINISIVQQQNINKLTKMGEEKVDKQRYNKHMKRWLTSLFIKPP